MAKFSSSVLLFSGCVSVDSEFYIIFWLNENILFNQYNIMYN